MTSYLEEAALNTVLDVENRRFDRIRFKNKCSNCSYTPSWSNLSRIPPMVFIILRNLALVAAVFLAIQHEVLWSLIATALFAALTLICLLTKRGMLEEKAHALNVIPLENRPWLAPTWPELKQRIADDHIFTAEEMNAFGSTGTFDIGYGRKLSEEYSIKAKSRKSEDRSRQFKKNVIFIIALAIFGGFQFSTIWTAGWDGRMEAANLFTANPQAGNKFVVQEKLHNEKARFVKKPDTYTTSHQAG